MKLFLMLSLTVLLSLPVFAQIAPSGNRIVASPDIREKLVSLALQNPQLEVADHQIKISKYNLKTAKGWWLNNISLSFNANEFTIKRIMGKKPDGPAGQQYYSTNMYPLYNVGVNIPIGGIFTQPAQVKAAREQVAIAQAQRNTQYRAIREAVLSTYEDYLTNKELLTVQSQITESSYNEFLQAKQKFRNGQISVLEYNAAEGLYHNQLKNRISAEHNFNLTKIQLETIIGVPLSSVLNNEPTLQTAPVDSSLSN